MAMYPGRKGEKMMTEPGSIGPGRNGEVVRIVMHTTWGFQANNDQAPVNAKKWSGLFRKVFIAALKSTKIFGLK